MRAPALLLLIGALLPLGACNTQTNSGATGPATGPLAAAPLTGPERDKAWMKLAPTAPVDPKIARATVDYPTREAPGTVIVVTKERRLYYVLPDGKAVRYPVAVGHAGMADGHGIAHGLAVGQHVVEPPLLGDHDDGSGRFPRWVVDGGASDLRIDGGGGRELHPGLVALRTGQGSGGERSGRRSRRPGIGLGVAGAERQQRADQEQEGGRAHGSGPVSTRPSSGAV